MRILVLSPLVPFPPKYGGAQRTYHLLRHWSERHQIDLVARPLGEPESEVRAGLSDLVRELHLVRTATPSRTWQRLRAVFGRRSLQYLRHFSSEIQTTLDRLPTDRYHLVIVEFAQMLYHRVAHLAPRVVLDAHNVESVLLERSAACRPPWQRGLAKREAARFREDERRLLQGVDGILATSDADRIQIAELVPDRPCRIVPNGIDPTAWSADRIPERPGARLLFVGSLDYLPNRDAAIRLAERILPRVQQRRPDACLDLVGATPPPEILRLGERPGVTVHASVPDVRPFYEASTLFVCPLRSGSGTRLKLLEASAAGLPIVATPLASEGLDLQPGEHLWQGRTDAALVRRVLEVLSDPAQARRRAERARTRVFERYGWKAAADAAEEFFESLSAVPASECRRPISALGAPT